MTLRGHLMIALTALLGAALCAPVARAGELPSIVDLRQEAALSQQKRLPILVMFSSDYCPYCVRVEEEFLKPMHNGGFYDDKVLIRNIKLGSRNLIDFDGRAVSASELAQRYEVSLTPTVIFIDHKGRQLAQQLVGLTTPDYYGGYLDQAIDTALERLRHTRAQTVKLAP